MTQRPARLTAVARLRALIRRSSGTLTSPASAFTAGGFAFDFATRTVQVDGRRVQLTSTEYHLLEVLVQHAGAVLPHQYLLDQVWGPEYVHDTHYLKVFVRRLRQKLGDEAEQPRYIQTDWGVGYHFLPPC